MSAHIKIEIEGSGSEVRAALEDLLGPATIHEEIMSEEHFAALKKVEIKPEAVEPSPIAKAVAPGLFKRCAHCGKDLTPEQVKSGANYCSRKCASLHTSKKMVETRKKNAEANRKAADKPVAKAPAGELKCLKCGKVLAKSQAKFCSKAHANQYNMNLRKSKREDKTAKEPHSSRDKQFPTARI